jgi:predicted nucleic acid-binding protein
MPTTYADSSALVKLIVPEPESETLADFFEGCDRLVSSTISEVEVVRAARAARRIAGVEDAVTDLLSRCALVELDRDLRRAAAALPPVTLKSLDAIQLASALSVREHVDTFVTYDRRLAEAATDAGLKAVSPGRE